MLLAKDTRDERDQIMQFSSGRFSFKSGPPQNDQILQKRPDSTPKTTRFSGRAQIPQYLNRIWSLSIQNLGNARIQQDLIISNTRLSDLSRNLVVLQSGSGRFQYKSGKCPDPSGSDILKFEIYQIIPGIWSFYKPIFWIWAFPGFSVPR